MSEVAIAVENALKYNSLKGEAVVVESSLAQSQERIRKLERQLVMPRAKEEKNNGTVPVRIIHANCSTLDTSLSLSHTLQNSSPFLPADDWHG